MAQFSATNSYEIFTQDFLWFSYQQRHLCCRHFFLILGMLLIFCTKVVTRISFQLVLQLQQLHAFAVSAVIVIAAVVVGITIGATVVEAIARGYCVILITISLTMATAITIPQRRYQHRASPTLSDLHPLPPTKHTQINNETTVVLTQRIVCNENACSVMNEFAFLQVCVCVFVCVFGEKSALDRSEIVLE